MSAGASPHDSAILSDDTDAATERRQIDTWRRQSPIEKLHVVSETTRAVLNLSLAGIRRRHPGASDRECFLRLASIMLGADVVRAMYPDAVRLSDLDHR